MERRVPCQALSYLVQSVMSPGSPISGCNSFKFADARAFSSISIGIVVYCFILLTALVL
jgi:hypothetical protein